VIVSAASGSQDERHIPRCRFAAIDDIPVHAIVGLLETGDFQPGHGFDSDRECCQRFSDISETTTDRRRRSPPMLSGGDSVVEQLPSPAVEPHALSAAMQTLSIKADGRLARTR
jgi:hypothetical protein